MLSVPGILQALATVFLKGLTGSLGEGSPFVSVPCCALWVLWMGAIVLDVGLDSVFGSFVRASLLPVALRELTIEKLSRDSGLIPVGNMPSPLDFGFHARYLVAASAGDPVSCFVDFEVRQHVFPVDVELGPEATSLIWNAPSFLMWHL